MARLVYVPREVVEASRLKKRLEVLNKHKRLMSGWDKHFEKVKGIRLRHDVALEVERFYNASENAGRYSDHQIDLGEEGGFVGGTWKDERRVRIEPKRPPWAKKILKRHVGIAKDKKGRWWAWSEKGEIKVNGRMPFGLARLYDKYIVEIGGE